MKVLILSALVALALSASPRWERRHPSDIRVQSFRAGYEYRYAFDGQVSTGLPQSSQQHSSTRVQADVSIYFKDQQIAILQLNNIRFGSLNRQIAEPREVQPFGIFDKESLHGEHQKQLELPVRFVYENGFISNIEFDIEDKTWSENIKRSILNLIQVNLQKASRKDQQELRLLKDQEEPSSNEKYDFFIAEETTLEGKCDVSYTLTEQQQSESRQQSLQVSKSINFESCVERPDIRYNLRFGEACNSCDKKFAQKERNVESTSIFMFNITGSPSEFLIREAEVRSQYVFAPLNEQENTISTYVCAKLQLLEAVQEKTVQQPSNLKKQQQLLYSAAWDKQKEKFHMNGDRSDEFSKETPYTEMKNKVETVKKIVNQIVKDMSDEQKGMDSEVTHQMARLVKILRTCSQEEIKNIHREIYENSQQDQQQIKDIMDNAMALAGTKNTIQHIMEKIESGQISPVKASQVIKALVNVRAVSHKQLDLVENVCKSNVAQRNPILKQSCWLTYGAMLNGLCGENEDKLAVEEDEVLCDLSIKEKYVNKLLGEFNQATTRYQKVLALKTLANAGIDVSAIELEKIIRDRAEERTVRMQAIDALRQLRTFMPRKIQNILMPVYKNKFEHPDVRMSAFVQIMHTLPERHILDQIASQLVNERSQQVQAFVYSAFLGYANSTNPCEKQLAQDVQIALRMMRVQQPESFFTSAYKQLPLYSQTYKSGLTFNWGALFANDSILPKELSASFDTVFLGQWNKYMAQVGIQQQNLDQVLLRLVRKVQDNGFDEVVVRGKRSSSFRPTDLLRGLFEKLSIKSRRSQDSEEPHALLYIRFKNLDYAIIPLDEQTIPDMVKDAVRGGKLDLSQIERFLAQGFKLSTTMASFLYETSRKIPTSMGMPLVVNGKMPTVFTVEGRINVELQPKNSDKLSGVKIHIVAQPQVATTHVAKMEIWSPIVNTGVKVLHSVQISLPIDATTTLNVEKSLQTKTQFKAIEMKKRIAQLHSRVISFVRPWPTQTRSYVETREKTVYSEQLEKQIHPVQRSYAVDSTGLQLSVVGNIHRKLLTSVEGSPLPILGGENILEVYCSPSQLSPREYSFEFEVEPYVEVQNMGKPDSLKQFYNKKSSSNSDEFFDTESYESEEQSESDRRQHYDRYVQNYKGEKAYKHRVSFVAKAGERRADAILEAVCDEETRFCKINLKAERTPINEETSKWTLNVDSQILYPEVPKSLQKLRQMKHRELTGAFTAKWGCEQKSRIEIQIQGEQNREQKSWLRQVDRKQGGLLEEQDLIEASTLNQFKIDITYNVQPAFKNIVNKVYQYAKAYYYSNTWQQVADNTQQQQQIQAQLTIDPETRRYANLTISSTLEKIVISEMRLPMAVGLNIHRPSHATPSRSVQQFLKNVAKSQRAECAVKSSKIETFDNVVYGLPLTTCYSVLAKDCSSSSPAFAVLIRKISKTSQEKKLKVLSEENMIEVSFKNQDFDIRVNQKAVQDSQLERYGITESGDVVVIELDDVTVRFDGFTAKIQLSQAYQSQACGLCGNHDNEQEDEFRRADNELTDDLEDFHRSYFSQDDECDIEETKIGNKKNYKIIDSDESSQEQDEDDEQVFQELSQWQQRTKKPVLKTNVIEYNHRICFSKEPVPECPRKSFRSDESTEKKVKFACIERSHPEAKKLARLAQSQVVDVQSFPDSFVESIAVPKACVAY